MNNWQEKTLGEIGIFKKGFGISKKDSLKIGLPAVRYGELYTIFNFKIDKINTFVSPSIINELVSIIKGDILFASSGETAKEIAKSAVYNYSKPGYAGGDILILKEIKNNNSFFLVYLLNNKIVRKELLKLGQGQSVVHIYKKDLESLKLKLPELAEQERIVGILEIWDQYLEKLDRQIELNQRFKKGMMQQIFSQKLRFANFSDNYNWKNKQIGEVLNYEQPTKYLVSNTEYLEFGTPVLTANKSFILGYTDEKNGIYLASKNDPVIIFDDFTTDNKFVDFNFKIKSSAIKMLKANSAIETFFIYLTMQRLNFIVGGHKRHYISEYQYNDIKIPPLPEQQKIADFLSTIDQKIGLLEKKRDLADKQRKFLLNNLVSGKIRTPENILEKGELS